MTPEERQKLAAEFAKIEGDITTTETEIKNCTDKEKSANNQATIGGVGILLGLVLLIFFWPLGLLLVIAGPLAYLSQKGQARDWAGKREAAEKKLGQLRSDRATKQAMLMAG